jgi:hypothetical protein
MAGNMHGGLPLEIDVDGRRCESHSTYRWSGGGTVLTISTVLPDRGLALELISTYVGHPRTNTIAVHLLLGPGGEDPALQTMRHCHEELDPIEQPRTCAYDHVHELVDALQDAGR